MASSEDVDKDYPKGVQVCGKEFALFRGVVFGHKIFEAAFLVQKIRAQFFSFIPKLHAVVVRPQDLCGEIYLCVPVNFSVGENKLGEQEVVHEEGNNQLDLLLRIQSKVVWDQEVVWFADCV